MFHAQRECYGQTAKSTEHTLKRTTRALTELGIADERTTLNSL